MLTSLAAGIGTYWVLFWRLSNRLRLDRFVLDKVKPVKPKQNHCRFLEDTIFYIMLIMSTNWFITWLLSLVHELMTLLKSCKILIYKYDNASWKLEVHILSNCLIHYKKVHVLSSAWIIIKKWRHLHIDIDHFFI
mgnify:CR=1 FL=1